MSFRLTRPATLRSAAVFASPHSGRDYDRAFLDRSRLDAQSIRSSEDAFLDLLLEDVPDMGAPLLCATKPRAFVDLNRSADELDPALIKGLRKSTHNPRVASGLGVIPRVVANGKEIYRGKIDRAEAEARLEGVYRPYHACLASLLGEARATFGEAILFDFHSMPHEALEAISNDPAKRPEIILGDRFGSACRPAISEEVEAIFAARGFRVVRNSPFAGAYITQNYGRPSRDQHVIQIEIDRSLYMNERLIRPNGNFARFKAQLTGILAELAELGTESLPMAAE